MSTYSGVIATFVSFQSLKSVINHGISSWRIGLDTAPKVSYAVLFANHEGETADGKGPFGVPQHFAHLIFKISGWHDHPEARTNTDFAGRRILVPSHYARVWNSALHNEIVSKPGDRNPVRYMMSDHMDRAFGPSHRQNWIDMPA